MKQAIALLVVFHFSLQSSFAPEPEPVRVTRPTARVLKIKYRAECDVHGYVESVGRRIRFDLWAATGETELIVDNDDLHFEGDCRARELALSWSEESDLVVRHAPYIVVRPDQAANRETDVPLVVSYSIVPTGRGTRLLRYTLYLTDEDSQPDAAGTEFQMARYGRRTDIEWVYEVELGMHDEIVARFYQGDIFMGAGHARYPFRGEFVAGTEHPILYNIATHNVFSDHGSQSDAYALAPRARLVPVDAREQLMFRLPWMFAVSDRELVREGKLAHPYDEYLYVRLDGRLFAGRFTAEVEMDGKTVESGGGEGDIDRLGEDLWGQESFTAIPLDVATIEMMGNKVHGKFRFHATAQGAVKLRLDALRFTRFRNGAAEDISERFRCVLDGISTVCEF